MENLTSWGQFGLYVAGSLALVVFSVSHLFKSMTSTYGGIIAAQGVQVLSLQTQNTGQQREIDTLKVQHEKCEQDHLETKLELMELRTKVDGVEKKVDGKHDLT